MCEKEGRSHGSKPSNQTIPVTPNPQGSIPFRSIFTVKRSIVMPSTSTHPPSPATSPLHGAQPPKDTAVADRGEVIFHVHKADQSMKKLERNYRSLEADPSYDQQVRIPEGSPKRGPYLCSAAVPQPGSCPCSAVSWCPVMQPPAHPSSKTIRLRTH